MKKRIRHMMIVLTAWLPVLWLAGCDSTVLEFPDDAGGVDPSLVHVNLNLSVDPSIEPFAPAGRSEGAAAEHDVRWMVEVFRDEIDGEPEFDALLTCDPADDGQHATSTALDLHAGKYIVVAWADYVDDGSTADKYYSVPSLDRITIAEAGDYLGDEEHKDTYVAVEEVDLTGYHDQWNAEVAHAVTLERPMAKIEFITTDVDKLLADLEEARSGRASSRVPLSDNLLSDNPDLNALRVTVEYAGYLPSGFNVYTNKPNDAVQGMSFTCSLTRLSGNEARLGSDYIFVNGNESAVTVNLVIRDDAGNLVNRVDGINVPIARGKLTTIRDEFLTKDYAPGIGIDPDFEGEIDIVIPD